MRLLQCRHSLARGSNTNKTFLDCCLDTGRSENNLQILGEIEKLFYFNLFKYCGFNVFEFSKMLVLITYACFGLEKFEGA